MSKKQEEIKKFYDNVYYKDNTQISVTSKHLKNLARKIGILKNQKVLDVACGTGSWLFAVSERGANVSGIDLSEKAIETCWSCFPEGDFKTCSAEILPFDDNQFDVVSCLGALEHFLDPKKALQEMVRVAKKDAIILLLVPNADFLTRRLGLYFGTYQKDIHEIVYTLDEWQEMFVSTGLTIKKRWKDLHVLSTDWIFNGKWFEIPVRALQALLLVGWPLSWQYQVYFLCKKK
jgi:ubiquinone/menaquinone biosynthesis C-methylase UbiE